MFTKQIYVAGNKRGKTRDEVTIGLGFSFNWLRKWHEFFQQITGEVNEPIRCSRSKYLRQALSAEKHLQTIIIGFGLLLNSGLIVVEKVPFFARHIAYRKAKLKQSRITLTLKPTGTG